MKQLQGKMALITGASRGIGVDIARALAAEGMDLALAARSEEALAILRDELLAKYPGRKIEIFGADLSRREVMTSLIDQVEAKMRGIDVLVNNAGIEQPTRYEELSLEDIDKMIDINLRAPMFLSRLVLPGMIARGQGHIVNIASLAGLAGVAQGEPYSATKHGLVGFTRALRASARVTGSPVSASVICPGFISDVGMFAKHQQEIGIKPPVLLGISPPTAVSRAVVRAIRKDQPEVIVNPGAPQLLIAFGILFPKIGEWLAKKVGADHVGNALLQQPKDKP